MRALLTTVALLVVLALAPGAAHALTVRDTVERTVTAQSEGCDSVVRDVTLPARTRSARLLEPAVGDELRDLDSDEVVARVDAAELVRRDGRRVARVTVSGVSCEPAPAAGQEERPAAVEWTAELAVRVRVARAVRVFFPQVCCGGRHDERPRTLLLGASFRLFNASWSAWGGPVARGRATVPFNNCQPSCAQGTTTEIPARVRLTRPRLCNGVYQYLTVSYTMLHSPPGGGRRSGRWTFGFRCE